MNYLVHYALKNLTRNKRRTALTLFGIIMATAFLILGNSLINGLLSDITAVAVRSNGHLVIQTKEYTRSERTMPLDKGITDSESIRAALKGYPEVQFATPRYGFGGIFSRDEEAYTAVGNALDTAVEKDFLKLTDKITSGGWFTGSGPEVIVGVEIAKKLGLQPGDSVTFVSKSAYGSLTGGKFRVAGIIDYNLYEQNRTFLMDLAGAEKLLKTDNMPQRMVVVLKNKDAMGSMKRKLLKDKAIVSQSLDVFKVDEIGIFQSMFPIIIFIARFLYSLFLLVAAITIANTMMMTVLERTAEIGVLQAMGMKREKVAFTFLLEACIMGLTGSLIGAIIGTPVAYYFQTHGIQLGEKFAKGMPIAMQNTIYPEVTFSLVLTITIIGVVVAVLAGAIPSLRAVRLNPALAIREQGK